MLRDSDREPSADLEQQDNPTSDAPFDDEAARPPTTTAMTEEFIENSIRWLDSRNSKTDGSAKLAFKVTIFVAMLQIFLVITGKHYLPSLLQGLEVRSRLLARSIRAAHADLAVPTVQRPYSGSRYDRLERGFHSASWVDPWTSPVKPPGWNTQAGRPWGDCTLR